MRRWLVTLLAVGIAMSWVPFREAQAASLLKTDDGLEFKFGMAQKVQFFTLDHGDFTDNVPTCKTSPTSKGECNFRSFTSPDTNVGVNPFGIWNFTNLLFDLSKGPISIHANLEVEATIDENVADINGLNLERASLTWKTGVVGDLTVGFDVHLFDPEGGLIYQDEDPGIWLIGSQGMVSWNIGYHKRLARNRGRPLGTILYEATVGIPIFTPGNAAKVTDIDTDIFEARLGFNFPLPGGNLSISPLFLANIRHSPDGAGFGIASCPTGGCGASPGNLGVPGVDGRRRAEIYYPGIVATGKFGPLSFTAEGVAMLGEIDNLGPNFTALVGKSSADFESFAAFGEIALDLTAQGIGITPFLNVDYRRGDDNPFDDTLEGYVAISDLTGALRKDGFRLQSISSVGGVTLGNGGEDGWGFNTTGRGIGPTVGTILEGFGADTSQFNSRWGKADNPGHLKITAGMLGKITPQIDMKGAVSYFRFDTTESIKAEAALNRDARGLVPATVTCGGVAFPKATTQNTAGRTRCIAGGLNVDESMGVEINFNIGWSPVPAFRIQPFVSVFIPLEGAEDISRLFLDSAETQTAYMAGIEFRAQF